MGWPKTPLVASGDLITESVYDHIKAAIDERYDAVGASFGKPAAVSAGDLNQWTTITSYRSKIESLLSSFYVKSGSGESTTFTAWTKSNIMTACFGAGVTDWPNKDNKLLLASHFADMQTVLDKLEWLYYSRYDNNGGVDRRYGDMINDTPWGDAKDNAWANMVAKSPQSFEGLGSTCGHNGEGYPYGSGYNMRLIYFDNSKYIFDTSGLSGLAVLGAVVAWRYRHLGFDTSNYHADSCDFTLTAGAETILDEVTVVPDTEAQYTWCEGIYECSSPFAWVNTSGDTYVYGELSHPGDDASDREENWVEPRYYNRGVHWLADLYLQAQFSYRAAA